MPKALTSLLHRSVIALLCLATSAVVALAQTGHEPPAPVKDAADVKLSTDLVKTGLYIITGGGGNSLLRLNAIGAILLNAKAPGSYRPLMSQIRRISKFSDLPVRALIVSDHHDNHIGNAAQFAAAGIPLLVQESVKPHLPAVVPASGKRPAPTVTFDREYTMRMGGVEVQLFHFGNARTNSDTVVYFPDLKVVAVGDLYNKGPPAPDFAGGGSLVNWGPVLAQILKLDFTIVVPSEGPPVSRGDLEAYKAKVDTLTARATALAQKGVPKAELSAQLDTADLGWRFNVTGDQLDRLHAELTQKK